MKVALVSIRADGDGTIAVWALPNGHQVPIRYKMPIAKYIALPKCFEGDITIPFESSADMVKPDSDR